MSTNTPRTAARKAASRKTAAASGESAARPAAGKFSDDLGARLRHAREQFGITVRELARRIGVSPSLISQVERGRVMPSVGTLFSIANELGLVIDDLFKSSERQKSARARQVQSGPVQRHDNRKSLRMASGVRWERLTAGPDPEVEFLYVVYDVGSASCQEDSLFQHGGKEYAYVLSGHLGVRIGFDEYELGPGDAISFDAQLPHRLWCVGREAAIGIFAIFRRQGDARQRVYDDTGRTGEVSLHK